MAGNRSGNMLIHKNLMLCNVRCMHGIKNNYDEMDDAWTCGCRSNVFLSEFFVKSI